MRLNEIKVPFRWYSDLSLTTLRNNECRSFRYKLITPKDRLLPFLFRFPSPAETKLPVHLFIHNADTDALELTVDDYDAISQIDYYQFNEWDYFVYKGAQSLNIVIPSGFHYAVLELEDGTKFYSETFWVDCDPRGSSLVGDFSDDFNDDFNIINSPTLEKYTKLMWWNKCDIGNLLYQTGYANILYLDTDFIKTETEVVEEGQEDGNEDFVPSFIKNTDKIIFSDYAPEYIINALSGVHLHEFVYVTTKDDVITSAAKRFNCKYTYENHCHGKVDVEYLQETVLMRSSCCGNNTLRNVYQCQTQISDFAYQMQDNGDGTSAIVLQWNVLLGPGPFRVMSPQIAGGAPTDVAGTNHPIGNWAHGTQLYISVKPVCQATNGRVMYGNELTQVINVQ